MNLMEMPVKKYKLGDGRQEQEDLYYWREQTIEHKIKVLESIRRDAIKLGLFPGQKDQNGDKQRLRRVIRIIKQT